MLNCYPCDNIDYFAKDVRMFHIGRTAGVINYTGDDFKTASGSGMQVIVSEGYAYLQCGSQNPGGVTFSNDGDYPLTIEPADALLDRYDAIVLRYSASAAQPYDLVVVKGTPASDPQKYKPVRNTDTFELVIKYVKVKHGISLITDDLIEDAIMDESVCGIAIDTLARIPTAQYDAQIKAFVINNERAILDWFETIKGALAGDVAVNLSTQIADLTQRADRLEARISKQENRIVSGVGAPESLEDGQIYLEKEGE